MENHIGLALLLTIVAGLSTGIGSLVALIGKRTDIRFLCIALGFSAGIMLYVSFMEIMPEARLALESAMGARHGTAVMLLAFFGGMGLIHLIDLAVPESINPHEMHGLENQNGKVSDKGGIRKLELSVNPEHRRHLKRTGLFSALTIAIHNFPEGIATFTSALGSLDVALPIVLAIAIHNIPEGVAVAVPIYHATASKKKAFLYSFLSGLAEPAGALLAYAFLLPFWNETLSGILLAIVSGIMVFISLDELLPSAERYGRHHWSIAGVVAGMLLMAVSLFLLG